MVQSKEIVNFIVDGSIDDGTTDIRNAREVAKRNACMVVNDIFDE